MEGHGHAPESGPGDQSAEEVFPFLELEQVVHDAAVDQSELSGARRHRYSRQGREDPIEHRGGRALERPDVRGILAVGEHDGRARLPLSHQLGDQRRRMLQIGVHGHDRLARGVPESGQNGRLLTEAPGQTDPVNPPVAARDPADGRPGPVGASVIDEHELVLPLRRAEVGADGVVQRIEIGLLVVAGRDDGDERPAAIRHHSRLPRREASPRAGGEEAGAASAGRFVAALRDEPVAPGATHIPYPTAPFKLRDELPCLPPHCTTMGAVHRNVPHAIARVPCLASLGSIEMVNFSTGVSTLSDCHRRRAQILGPAVFRSPLPGLPVHDEVHAVGRAARSTGCTSPPAATIPRA